MWVDGNRADRVIDATIYSVNSIRHNHWPFYLECDTTRLGKHKQGQGDIRTKEEIAELAKRDPLLRIDLSDARRREIEAEVDDVITRARAAPDATLQPVV